MDRTLHIIALILAAIAGLALGGCDQPQLDVRPTTPVVIPHVHKHEVIDFYATWCGPCREQAPTVDRLKSLGYPIRKVDIDQEPGLAAKHGIESVPTYVILCDGRETGRTNNVADVPDLLKAK